MLICHQAEVNLPGLWREPIVKFTGAGHPDIPSFRNIVYETHYMPKDFMVSPTVIVVYFVPFSESVVKSNIGGRYVSEPWIQAYTHAEAFLPKIDDEIIAEIERSGYHAVSLAKVTAMRGRGFTKAAGPTGTLPCLAVWERSA